MPTPVAFDEKGELEQVNVLYSFLEDRYMKTVCGFFFESIYFVMCWLGLGVGVGAACISECTCFTRVV